MSEDAGARFNELCQYVLAPLIFGGALRPVRPFGPTLGRTIGQSRSILDSDLRSRIDVARVRRARLLAPIDSLPPITEEEFALAAAFSDLLQATNHELGGAFRGGRYTRLFAGINTLIGSIAPPRTVLEALSRHTLFGRVFETKRTDVNVSWWTGKARFRGQKPPSRLLAWPSARRVNTIEENVELAEMCTGFDGAEPVLYENTLRLWLTRTPLTDLENILRLQPLFRWTEPTLSLVAIAPGRTLALRVLGRLRANSRSNHAQMIAVLERAQNEILPASPDNTKQIAASFLEEVRSLADQKSSGKQAQAGV